jgi:hypothetical protein
MTMALDPVVAELSARAGDRWEIFAKRAAATELRVAAPVREESERLEDGCAARWEEKGQSQFAAASSPALLVEAIRETARVRPGGSGPLPSLPSGTYPQPDDPSPAAVSDSFEEVAQLLASESKGQARLT